MEAGSALGSVQGPLALLGVPNWREFRLWGTHALKPLPKQRVKGPLMPPPMCNANTGHTCKAGTEILESYTNS